MLAKIHLVCSSPVNYYLVKLTMMLGSEWMRMNFKCISRPSERIGRGDALWTQWEGFPSLKA